MVALSPSASRLFHRFRPSLSWRPRMHGIVVHQLPTAKSHYFYIRGRRVVSGHKLRQRAGSSPIRAVWRGATPTARDPAPFSHDSCHGREKFAGQSQQPTWRLLVFWLVVAVEDKNCEKDTDSAHEEYQCVVNT